MLNDLIVENGVNKNDVTFKNRFIWIQETLNEQIKSGTKIELSKQLVISYKKAEYNREVPPNLIDSQVGVDTTENAGRSISQIFDGKKIFDYPKPTSLLTYLINFFIQNNENFYKRKFKKMDETGKSVSWNWAAFFMGIYWMVYR